MEMGESVSERRNRLQTYISESKLKNRRAINNGIHVSQQIKMVPMVYRDFQSFGKLGVSSFKLNWDYSIINGKSKNLACKPTKSTKAFKKAARFLSKYSDDELRLISCLLWNNGKILSSEERETANQIMRNTMEGS